MAVPKAYLAAVAAASQKYHVPAELLAAQIQAESGWNPKAKSPMGATGISQFMPGTAKGMGIDPTDPLASIDAQGKMMGRLIKSYGGNQDKALAAYNAGAGAVAKYGGIPPFQETHDYIKRIHGYESNYPGLKADKVSSTLSPDTVKRAATYSNMIGVTPGGSQTAPKGSSGTTLSDSSSGSYDALGALTGYLINQSTPAHGSSDPTAELMSVLTAPQEATQNVVQARGAKASIPTSRGGATVSPTASTAKVPVVGTGDKYKLIGLPNQGTHTLYGNWESDNAIDIAVPAKTPVYATEDGTISDRLGSLHSSDPHMAGLRVNLTGKDNNFYYQHLQSISVKAGQKVKKGDLLGYSGALNHVHFAVEKGDPRNYYK